MDTDYFSFYQLPISYFIDKDLLRKKYIDLSRSTHPDFHTQSTPSQQNQALQDSLQNNKAYKTLSDDALRLRYYLELQGIIQVEEKYQLPSDFLMEMMEINERIQETSANTTEAQDLQKEVATWETNLQHELQKGIEQIENESLSTALKNNLKENYYKQKYLLRIKESLNTFAAS